MRLRSILLSASALALLAGPAFADNTDDEPVTVTGSVVAPLELAVVGSLDLPDIIAPSTGEADSTLTIAASTTADGTYSSGADPTSLTTDNAATPPTINVTGEDGLAFGVAVGAASGFPTGVSFLPNCAAANGTLSGGADTINCGGTLTVTASAATGNFSLGTFDLTVTYN